MKVSIYGLGTRLGFDAEQIEIFIGELDFMLPVNSQVKHSILFPRIEHIKIQSTKCTENQLKYYQILSNFKYHQCHIRSKLLFFFFTHLLRCVKVPRSLVEKRFT